MCSMRLALSLLAASEEVNLLRSSQWVGAFLPLGEKLSPTQLFQIETLHNLFYYTYICFSIINKHI